MKRVISIPWEVFYRGLVAIPVLFLAIALIIQGVNPWIVRALIVLVMLAAAGVVKHMRYGEMQRDERTERIGLSALSYSWFVTLLLVGVLMGLELFDILKLTTLEALASTAYVMLLVTVCVVIYHQVNDQKEMDELKSEYDRLTGGSDE